jgi:putative selenium metabolism protein SsnA
MQIALTGGLVVGSLDPASVAMADVLVEDGRVVTVGQPIPDGVPRHDCAGGIVIPGNVNAHTHLYSALARGMTGRGPAPRSFLEILQRVWWRLDRALEPETIRASALAGGLEALLAGTTTLVDHHASPSAVDGSLDIVAGALDELGIRSVLCYETSDRDRAAVTAAGLAENARFIEAVDRGRWPLAQAMVGAHASFTLGQSTLEACAALARRRRRGLHIHVAEDQIDERDALARDGQRVVQRLDAAGALDERTLVAHGVHLDEAEIEVVRSAGATVVHNPRSNLNNGVGHAPLALLGERVALGTDGIGADMFEEARAAYTGLRSIHVTTTPGWAMARLARGAAVAGAAFGEAAMGRIEPGAPADLVVLDAPPPTPLDTSNLAGHWIFGFSSAAVRDVFVAGRPVVIERRPVRVERAAVAAASVDGARRLWARLETVEDHPFAPPSAAAAAGTRR